MHIFVASWFFPPNSSSEGFVTYKLLKNSKYEYDVVCSTSHKWGYAGSMTASCPNVHVHAVETEELSVWVDKAVEKFEELHRTNAYDAIMTRSMPPESVLVGMEIKRRYPQIKWIASFGDPIANNPYSMAGFAQGGGIVARDAALFVSDMAKISSEWCRDWRQYSDRSVRVEAGLRALQDYALDIADMIICPVLEQKEYMCIGRAQKKPFYIVPHSYEENFYSEDSYTDDVRLPADKVNLVYLGYSDYRRSLLPVVKALRELDRHYPRLARKICLHVFGNYPHELSDYVYSTQMSKGLVEFHGNCSYAQSISIMRHADWLLHVDAFFPSLATGGSIFFAGKIADYIGAGKPILAITGTGSPAYHMVKDYGGIVCQSWDFQQLIEAMARIADGKACVDVNAAVRSGYDARSVARRFDDMLESEMRTVAPATSLEVIGTSNASKEKLLTICVPCYNGANTICRCLDSILATANRDLIEVIVVDDGSRDNSAEIVRGYVERYPGIVTLIRKPNGGHGSGVNTGIEHGIGLYFRVLDADDWVDSVSLQKQIEYFSAHRDCPADVCYTNYHVVNAKDETSWPWPQPRTVEYGKIYNFSELDVSDVYLTMHGSSFLLDVLRRSGLKCHEHCFYVDSEYILKPIPFVSTVVFLDLYIYKYWQGQEGQSVSATSFVRNYENHATVMKSLIEYYKMTPMPMPQSRYFYRLLKEHLRTHYHIILDLDHDRKRSRGRCREFNSFLRGNYFGLYAWCLLRLQVLRGVGVNMMRCKIWTKKMLKAILPYGAILLLNKLRGRS